MLVNCVYSISNYMYIFQRVFYVRVLKAWDRVLTLSQTSPDVYYKSFENTVGKGEIARNEQFLFFPQCFLPFSTLSKNCQSFLLSFKLSSAIFFSLEESKICCVVWERVKRFKNVFIRVILFEKTA